MAFFMPYATTDPYSLSCCAPCSCLQCNVVDDLVTKQPFSSSTGQYFRELIMLDGPTVQPSRSISLTRKLREFGRVKFRTEDKEAKAFEIIHTPDRPSRIVTPIEAPTEDECGDDIASWHRTSARRHYGMSAGREHGLRMGVVSEHLREALRRKRQEKVLTWLRQQEGIATTNEDDDVGGDRYYHAAGPAYRDDTGHAGQSATANVMLMPRSRPSGLTIQGPAEALRRNRTGQPHQQPHAAAGIAPSRGISGPTSHTQSVSPALETLDMHNLSIRKEAPGGTQPDLDEAEEQPVDTANLVRLEKYRRGYCPFCGKFFGNPLPTACPYQDCKRDLSMCLESRGPRRQQERQQRRAPPPLVERAFLDAQAHQMPCADGQGVEVRQRDPAPINTSRPQAVPYTPEPLQRDDFTSRSIPRRQAIDNLRAQAPPRPPTLRPSPSPHRRSPKPPSPSNIVRTIWPAPSTFQEAATREATSDRASEQSQGMREEHDRKHKPFLPPPRPTRREEGSCQQQGSPQNLHGLAASTPLRRQQHIASQLRNSSSPYPSPSSPLSSSPQCSISTIASRATPNLAPSRSGSGSSAATSTRARESQVQTKSKTPGQVRTRSRPVTPLSGDDIDYLAWKRPEELAEFEKQIEERGDDADLFLLESNAEQEEEKVGAEEDMMDGRGYNADALLDIIGEYEDEPQGCGRTG